MEAINKSDKTRPQSDSFIRATVILIIVYTVIIQMINQVIIIG